MMNAAVLYKHLKKWTCQPKDHRSGWYNCLTFGDNKVIATNTHRLVVVKNYPTVVPHLENAKGEYLSSDGETRISPSGVKEDDQKFITEDLVPKALKVIPSNEDCQWSESISSTWFPQMKNALDFVRKMSKKDRYPGTTMLNFHHNQLFAIGANESYGAKFLLANKLNEGKPWYCYWNAGYLMDALDLVIDSKVPAMKFSVAFTRSDPVGSAMQDIPESKLWTGIWKIETEDVVMISTSIRLSEDHSEMPELIAFAKSESVRPESGAFIEQ